MVKTKSTPRKQGGLETMEKKTLACPDCRYKTVMTADMTRHRKRHTDSTGNVCKDVYTTPTSDCPSPSTSTTTVNTDTESWNNQDPGDLIVGSSDSSEIISTSEDEGNGLLGGRTIRKTTRPESVQAPKRKQDPESFARPHPKGPVNMVPMPVTSGRPSAKRLCTYVHRATQTQVKTSRRTVTKTTRYSKDGRDIEVVEFEEFFEPEAFGRTCYKSS